MKEAAAAGPPPPLSARPAGKVTVAQTTNVDHAAPLQATAETGLVSEELLHRAIRSNVELAEALAGLVQSMNLGLGTILSHAELLMMYREEYYKPDTQDKGVAEVIVGKHRNGPTGTVRLTFLGDTKFENFASGSY